MCTILLYYILIEQSFNDRSFCKRAFLAESAKKLEPSGDSNFNTLGFVSLPCGRLQSLSGEKGNTLVSQKRMQRYDKFLIYANFSQKNMHFLCFLAYLCNMMIANDGYLGIKNAVSLA